MTTNTDLPYVVLCDYQFDSTKHIPPDCKFQSSTLDYWNRIYESKVCDVLDSMMGTEYPVLDADIENATVMLQVRITEKVRSRLIEGHVYVPHAVKLQFALCDNIQGKIRIISTTEFLSITKESE